MKGICWMQHWRARSQEGGADAEGRSLATLWASSTLEDAGAAFHSMLPLKTHLDALYHTTVGVGLHC